MQVWLGISVLEWLLRFVSSARHDDLKWEVSSRSVSQSLQDWSP